MRTYLFIYLFTYLPTYVLTYLPPYLIPYVLTHSLTHSLSLTPWSRVLLEKLTGMSKNISVNKFSLLSRFGRRPHHGEKLCYFRKWLEYNMQREQQQHPRNGGEIHSGILWSLWRGAVQRVCPKWKIDGNFVYVSIICGLHYASVSVPLHQSATLQTM
jgi:hypothetical protein